MRRRIVSGLLVVAAFAAFSLISGASYLEVPLPGGLPFGNALAALGLCSAAGVAIGLSPRGSLLRALSQCALLFAVVWLPLSIALAGNLALNFAEGCGDIWMLFSLVTALLVLSSLAWALVRALLARTRVASGVRSARRVRDRAR